MKFVLNRRFCWIFLQIIDIIVLIVAISLLVVPVSVRLFLNVPRIALGAPSCADFFSRFKSSFEPKTTNLTKVNLGGLRT